MFNATFYATVRNTYIRFKKGDTFPAMTVNVRLQSGDLCTVYSSNPIMMLFMMNSVTVDSDWLIQGIFFSDSTALYATPLLTRNELVM